MATGSYLSIITLNVNGLSASNKTKTGHIDTKIRPPIYAIYKKPTSNLGTHTD